MADDVACEAPAAEEPQPAEEAKDEAIRAIRRWLEESKRMEDFRFVARDVERLLEALDAVRVDDPGGGDCLGRRSWKLALVRGGNGVHLRSLYVCRRKHSEPQAVAAPAFEEVETDCFLFASFFAVPRVVRGKPLPKAKALTRPANARESAPGEAMLVEFHGRRSACGVVDEEMSCVDFEALQRLQADLAPAFPRAIVFLDLLLALPLAPAAAAGACEFRRCVLEEVLGDECWLEGSDSDGEAPADEEGASESPGADDEVVAGASERLGELSLQARPAPPRAAPVVTGAGKRLRR